ncbi:hypothetical protein CR513_57075, partial [Mucuna pruriens]
MLNETNFKVWKEAVEIVLDCMDLDLTLRIEETTPTLDNLQKVKIDKWECSNGMCLVIMKHFIPKAFRGFIFESQSASRRNIRECIMKVSNLATKLKSLKLELDEDLIVHLVLISLPTHFGQFKVSYNTQKDKWSLNELISHYVKKEERYDYLYLTHEKSQSLDVFKSFKVEVELQLGKKIKAIKSDCGGEYYSKYDGLGEQHLGPYALFLKECEIVS